MRGYLSAESADNGKIPVTSRTAVYRDPERGERIVAERDENVVSLGVADVTVSRRGNAGAPIVIVPREERIEIRNNGNSNGVTVASAGDTTDVAAGRIESVTTDATISIGYRTTLQLQIERDARIEQNVVNQGDGNVVMGDMTDNSTTVGDDNVMNRTDVGGGGRKPTVRGPGESKTSNAPETRSEPGTKPSGGGQPESASCPDCGAETRPGDAFCSGCGRELAAGEDDTRQFCQRHQRAYQGGSCPECAKERR